MSELARIGITVGDPAGVGPEIVASLLRSRPRDATIRVYAQEALFRRAAGDALEDCEIVAMPDTDIPADFTLGVPSAFTGRVAAASIRAATRDAMRGEIDAIVTAPISKTALAAAGVRHPGHTEFLAELSGADQVAMMFVSEALRLTLATIHIPLAQVPHALNASDLANTIRLTHRALVEFEGIEEPRIAVLGLNPHASEDGLFGDEEERILAPALEEVQESGIRAEGPFPADSFFLRRNTDFDGVIAMYHDQGLIPVKMASHGRAVNVTLGLPFLRTSVDHGTAFDIAGRGIASPDSLQEAFDLAVRWSVHRGRP